MSNRFAAAVITSLLMCSSGFAARAEQHPASASRHAATGERMTYVSYAEYLRRFNAGDDSYADFYADDVVFDHGPFYGVLKGRPAIVGFYRGIRTQLKETVTAGAVSIDNNRGVMIAELVTRLVASRDGVALASRKLNKGDAYTSRGVVVYKLSRGKIVDIRGAISGSSFEAAQ